MKIIIPTTLTRPKFFFSFLFFSFLIPSSYAQKPYFQQEVNYQINVSLDDRNHELTANETIEYINNSPDKLTFIYFHLWPNAYKNNKSAMAKQLLEGGEAKFQYAKEADRGYIDQLDFQVNKEKVVWELDSSHEDICKIILNKPLDPGERITITTPFHVKLPLGIYSRLGHMGQAYQITQWYPKPAVYDVNGWNQMPYLTQGEFYSEFGSFDVSITLPENYVVGATGDLVNGEREIQWLNNRAEETNGIAFFTKDTVFPVSSGNLKTLRYKQSNVHDFAWFADKRWHVLKGEVKLPHSGKIVTTWSMFTNSEAGLWKKSIAYINDAIYYYSLWNGDYPYNHCTAVDGALSAGAGMEYPNVTVIGTSGTAFQLETVIMHEVGHNWFYGILGSNERKHPWMDEGLNSFNENRYIETKYPEAKLSDMIDREVISNVFDLNNYKHKSLYELSYLVNARRNLDQPIELPAPEYSDLNYGSIVYSKTAIVFDYLMAYLGEEVMDKAMRQYFETWKFKHPQPNDLRKIIEEVSGKNLSWFFDDIIKTTKKLDYKIVNALNKNGSSAILIKNKGDIAAPFSISGIKDGKRRASVWYEGFNGMEVFNFPPGEYDQFIIDYELDMPETSRKNNRIRTRGPFKKIEPLKLQYLGSLENPEKTQIFYTPIGGWNAHDGWMLGMGFYSSRVPEQKADYAFLPMYGFDTKDLTGIAGLGYNFYPQEKFNRIRLSVEAQQFSYNESFDRILAYQKLSPKIEFYFKPENARSSLSQKFTYRNIMIREERIFNPLTEFRITSSIDQSTLSVKNFPAFYFNDLNYSLANKRSIDPYSFNINLQQHSKFLKAALEAIYKINYPRSKRGIEIRGFAGKFIYKRALTSSRFGFGMNGNTDYTYDHLFLGRNVNGGILNHQFAMNDGGFKNQTLVPLSKNWLVAVNLKIESPYRVIGLYADAGYASKYTGVVYDGGVYLSLVPGIFEIYLPLFMKDNLNQLTYVQKIRFVLNLNEIKPFESIRTFSN